MSKNNIIYHWVMYHLGIYLTIWLFDTYIYPFLQVAAQVQGGVKTKLWYKHMSCTCANPPQSRSANGSQKTEPLPLIGKCDHCLRSPRCEHFVRFTSGNPVKYRVILFQKWRHRCRGKKENNKDTKSLYTHA